MEGLLSTGPTPSSFYSLQCLLHFFLAQLCVQFSIENYAHVYILTFSISISPEKPLVLRGISMIAVCYGIFLLEDKTPCTCVIQRTLHCTEQMHCPKRIALHTVSVSIYIPELFSKKDQVKSLIVHIFTWPGT